MESIILNGKEFQPDSLNAIRLHLLALSPESILDITSFLEEWWSDAENIIVQTSGSTGTPKRIELSKKTVRESARKTIQFFSLKPGDTAVLCLSAKFIAGKLMLVRAIEGKLNLLVTEPESNPLINLKNQTIHFAAMVPMQVYSALQNPTTASRIKKIDTLLIGGGELTPKLRDELKGFKNKVYLSFGMTETATHVAVQQVGGQNPETYFSALPGVRFRLDNRHCLIIEADHLEQSVVTNDLVLLKNQQQFEWLGRWDNAINSGGIKHIPELIEKELEPYIKSAYFVAGFPDEQLGQKMVLVVEDKPWPAGKFEELIDRLSESLSRYELPRDVKFCGQFLRTPTDKIDRNGTIKTIIH